MPLAKPAVLVFAAMLVVDCASTGSVPPASDLAVYKRLFLTMPSHSAGFGMTTTVLGSPMRQTVEIVSSREVVFRAFHELRSELIGAGFDVVARDQDADAVVELTMGGVEPDGEAERAFIALRDADTGRIVATFRAQARLGPATVDELIERIAEAIEEMVEGPAAVRPLR